LRSHGIEIDQTFSVDCWLFNLITAQKKKLRTGGITRFLTIIRMVEKNYSAHMYMVTYGGNRLRPGKL